MRVIKKGLTGVLIILASVFLTSISLFAALCNPVSARMCVAVDDVATVYLNDTYVGTFNYVNWDKTDVYPTCIDLPAGLVLETGNYVALDVRNTECCEIWGSWSIETQCSDGTHSCISSDDNPMRLYNVPTPSDTPPPNDINGLPWWRGAYIEEPAPTWAPAVKDTGTIYGKLIYNPCTGAQLQPLSYNAGGAGEVPGTHIYMRQPFVMVPVTPLPSPNFTITKAFVTQTPTGPTTGFNTNDRVHYNLLVCNTGGAEPGIVTLTDDYANGFDFDGPYGGDCDGYGDGSPCSQNAGGTFTTRWMRGFPGRTCVTVTAKVVDYWLDSAEYCQTRLNWAGVHWPSGDFTPNITPDAKSNTVSVTMWCPTNTFTRTVTPVLNTPTFTPTFTVTPTFTLTSTRTRISTWTPTNSHTMSPTLTITPTFTLTLTTSRTWTVSHTPTPHPSGSETFTPTNSMTVTETITMTRTSTVTRTISPTWSSTFTRTVTPTYTRTVTVTITVTWANAITLSKTESAGIVEIGDTVQYCISFTNVGANPATFEIWDTIPGPMEFLDCSQDSTGDCTISTPNANCLDYEGASPHSCRLISWHMINVPAGATGSVCFWVLVARLQTVDIYDPATEFFADIRDWYGKILNKWERGREINRNIRGPDRTD
jgi:uncharacterized repeat protein (TIGR01451 family)